MRRTSALFLVLCPAVIALAVGPPAPLVLPRKEPEYRSNPRYALLTFGRDRVWVVIEGHYLYADRNGDGDLTDKTERKQYVSGSATGGLSYEFGNLRRIGGKKAQLHIRSDKDGERVSLSVGGVGYRMVVGVPKGLRFASRAKDAPVIPLDGPLEMIPWNRYLIADDQERSFTTYIGTPLPGGGMVAVDQDWPPEDAHPVAEFTFANKQKGGAPVRLRLVLKKRC